MSLSSGPGSKDNERNAGTRGNTNAETESSVEEDGMPDDGIPSHVHAYTDHSDCRPHIPVGHRQTSLVRDCYC